MKPGDEAICSGMHSMDSYMIHAYVNTALPAYWVSVISVVIIFSNSDVDKDFHNILRSNSNHLQNMLETK